MAKIMLTDEVFEIEEEIKGSREFSFAEILKGILFGGKDFVDEVNQAVDDAYAELELAQDPVRRSLLQGLLAFL